MRHGIVLELSDQRLEFFGFLSHSRGRFSVKHTRYSVECA
jgi:hypothetical protein